MALSFFNKDLIFFSSGEASFAGSVEVIDGAAGDSAFSAPSPVPLLAFLLALLFLFLFAAADPSLTGRPGIRPGMALCTFGLAPGTDLLLATAAALRACGGL